MEALRRTAEQSGASLTVTTEKDGVRMEGCPDFMAGIYLLRIGMEITPAEPFEKWLFSRIDA